MSTFKFNFTGEDTTAEDTAIDTSESIQWLESLEIKLSNQIKDLDLLVNHAKMFTSGDIEIGHVTISEISKEQNDDFSKIMKLAENKHSDLVTGIYEGGLKIWECTRDLIEYFEERKDKISFEGKQVLDLGCGTGILGIYAFMNKAIVTFQDYNKEIIENVTIPNVLLNIEENERETEIKRCSFFSGDWGSFNTKNNDVFDIIVTSETIYNESNYDKLLNLFLRKLNEGGSIYVAAKTHYFGVGGGTRQFEQIVMKSGLLKSELCWKSSGGIQREILKISRNILPSS